MAADETPAIQTTIISQYESPADGGSDEMAHATVSDQDRGPRKAARCATTGLVFGEPVTPMGWGC